MASLNRYNIESRYIPSLVCSVPFFFLGYYYLVGIDSQFWSSVTGLTLGGIGFTTAMLIVMVNFCRNFGKFLEEKVFNDGLSFPTTMFLLDNDTNLSPSYKMTVIKKIKEKFDIDLTHETEGTVANRRTINEAVRRINNIFFGRSDFVFLFTR